MRRDPEHLFQAGVIRTLLEQPDRITIQTTRVEHGADETRLPVAGWSMEKIASSEGQSVISEPLLTIEKGFKILSHEIHHRLASDAMSTIISSSGSLGSGAYSYDGNGLRVKKSVPISSPTTTTVYIISGSKVIAEYDNGAAVGSPSREYIYSGGNLIAKISGSTTTYYHQDHLSNRLVTNASGTAIEQLGHLPFGERWYDSSNEKWRFTSYERDSESTNDYALARYYVNRLGRFSGVDPLSGNIGDPQSLNHYAYVTNDPINAIDPMGMSDEYESALDDCADAPFSTGEICLGKGSALTGEGGTDEWGFNWWLSQLVSPAFFTDGYNSGPNFTEAELNPPTFYACDECAPWSYQVNIYVFGNGLDINPLDPNTQCNSMGCNWYSMSLRWPSSVRSGSGSGGGGGGDILDARANALAHALMKTGVQNLNNPCTYAAVYAGSALGGVGASGEAVELLGTAITTYWPQGIGLVSYLLFRQSMGGYPASRFIQNIPNNYNKARDAVQGVCNAMQ